MHVWRAARSKDARNSPSPARDRRRIRKLFAGPNIYSTDFSFTNNSQTGALTPQHAEMALEQTLELLKLIRHAVALKRTYRIKMHS